MGIDWTRDRETQESSQIRFVDDGTQLQYEDRVTIIVEEKV
jgi:hypothetical protein